MHRLHNGDTPFYFDCSLFPLLLFSTMKPLIRAVVLYLPIYNCPYPFSFAEADIFKHSWRKHTPNQTLADNSVHLDICCIFSKHLYIAFGKTNITCYLKCYSKL